MYNVYAHINNINGKIYIGITKQTVQQRWRNNGEGYKNSKYFYNAIKKYGWDNFEHEIISSNLNESEAKNFEILLIKKLETHNKSKGYNITLGGEGHNGYKTSAETRQKIKENHADISGENNYWYGKKLSQEHKEKMSIAKKGKYVGGNNPSARKIYCVTTKEIFNTAKEASEKYKISRTAIVQNLTGRTKSSGKLNDGTKLTWVYYVEGGNSHV